MLKVAVFGGGSTYTPELVKGFLDRVEQFPLDELWLMDIDADRLSVVGGFAKRMVESKGSPFKVVLTGDQRAGCAQRFVCDHPAAGGTYGSPA
jgi:6-phospho-beta-glucosidase